MCQLALLREVFPIAKLTFYSDLWRRAVSRPALPCPSSSLYFSKYNTSNCNIVLITPSPVVKVDHETRRYFCSTIHGTQSIRTWKPPIWALYLRWPARSRNPYTTSRFSVPASAGPLLPLPVPNTSGDGVLFSIDFFVSLFVCLFVCFFVSMQDYEKTAGPICTKFSWKVWSDHGTTWSHFWPIPRNRAISRCATRGRGLLCFRTTACFALDLNHDLTCTQFFMRRLKTVQISYTDIVVTESWY